jgi:hypothetical protein
VDLRYALKLVDGLSFHGLLLSVEKVSADGLGTVRGTCLNALIYAVAGFRHRS